MKTNLVQLFKYEELEGRTIERVADDGENHLFFFFTDDTYTIARACGYEIHDVEIMDREYSMVPTDRNIADLLYIGVITNEEYEVLKSDKDKRAAEKLRQSDLAKLAELKAKYNEK